MALYWHHMLRDAVAGVVEANPPFLRTRPGEAQVMGPGCDRFDVGMEMATGPDHTLDIERRELGKLHANVLQTMDMAMGLYHTRDTGTTEPERVIWNTDVGRVSVVLERVRGTSSGDVAAVQATLPCMNSDGLAGAPVKLLCRSSDGSGEAQAILLCTSSDDSGEAQVILPCMNSGDVMVVQVTRPGRSFDDAAAALERLPYMNFGG